MIARASHRPLAPRLSTALAAALAVLACQASSTAAEVPPTPQVDLPRAAGLQTAVFAAGCFWCVEAVFEATIGVTEVVSGYAGDSEAKAKYDLVAAGKTRHAEAVRITYDPAKVSYGQLLQVLFLTHDPTTLDRQGPDHGHQYRSAIFYASPEEKRVAEAYLAQLTAAKTYGSQKIVTTLEPLETFYVAEAYHQDFVRRSPGHAYVRAWAFPKLAKLREKLPELTKVEGKE